MKAATSRKQTATPNEAKAEVITITPPNFKTIRLAVKGSAPLLQLRFSAKADILLTQTEEKTPGRKRARSPKDVDALFKKALHVSAEGWYGIPCAAFRNAAISACRVVGYKMTMAKLALFVEADGYSVEDETPLVRITKGEPVMHTGHVRNATGVIDIRVRAIFKEWACTPRVRYDADLFKTADIVNLMYRAGQQVGVGEGRPDSRMSAGMGFGLFTVNLGEIVK